MKIPAPIAEYLSAIGRKDPSSEEATHADHTTFMEELHHKFSVSHELISHFIGNLEAAGEHIVAHVLEIAGMDDLAARLEADADARDKANAEHEAQQRAAEEKAAEEKAALEELIANQNKAADKPVIEDTGEGQEESTDGENEESTDGEEGK